MYGHINIYGNILFSLPVYHAISYNNGLSLCELQGPVYIAIYDYEAQDDDEVSFIENDHIILYEMIDEGWMYGIVQRTGHKGMIPANYVELVQ